MLAKSTYSSKPSSRLQRSNLPGNCFFWCVGSTVQSLPRTAPLPPPLSACSPPTRLPVIWRLPSNREQEFAMTSWQKAAKHAVLPGCQSCNAHCSDQPLKTRVLNGILNICLLLKISFFTRQSWTLLDVQ